MRKRNVFSLVLLSIALLGGIRQSDFKTSAISARAINVTNTSINNVRNYYSPLNSKPEHELKGEALLDSLRHVLRSGHQTISYADVWDWTMVTDRDWDLSPMTQSQINYYTFNDNPHVKLLYRNDNGTATAAKHQDAHGAVIDREHVWPKSLGGFGENAPAGTDLHALILADAKNNQDGHSNYPYGNVGTNYTPIGSYFHKDNPTNEHNYTGKRGTISYLGKTFTVYEPQDEDKGDIARAMFYMAARYSTYATSSDPYLKLTNDGSLVTTKTATSASPGYAGLLDTLLEWHEEDPVDDYEIRRNNLIYNNVQSNRNPFIDYPGWVDAIWGSKQAANPLTDEVSEFGASLNDAPTSLTITPTPLTIHPGDVSKLYVTVTPTNTSKSVTWASSNSSVATVDSDGNVTAEALGTTTITATSTKNTSVTKIVTVNVTTRPVAEDIKASFDSADVVTSTGYTAYQKNNWLLTFGGNNISGGTNGTQRPNANLSAYPKYAVSPVTTSSTAFAVAHEKALSDVSKITFKMMGGSNNERADIYLLASTNNTTFSQINLTGTNKQGKRAINNTLIEFEFEPLTSPTYFAVVFKDSGTGSKDNFRLDNIELKFIAGQAEPVTLTSMTYTGTPVTQYIGAAFNPAGLTFTGTYSDTTTDTLDVSNFTFSPATIRENTTEVMAMFEGVSVSISAFSVTERPSEFNLQFGGTHSTNAINVGDLDANLRGSDVGMFSFTAAERVYVDNTTTNGNGDLDAIKLSSANDNGSFSMKLNDGKGYEVTSITLSVRRWFNDLPTIKVNSLAAQSVTGDEYSDYTFNLSSPYAQSFSVTVTRRLYINNIKVAYRSPADEFNSYVMAPTDVDAVTDDCYDNFTGAVALWNNMNIDAKEYFSTDASFSEARARLVNWSIANDSTLFLSFDGPSGTSTDLSNTTQESTLAITLIIALLGLTTLAGYYFLSRKEKQSK